MGFVSWLRNLFDRNDYEETQPVAVPQSAAQPKKEKTPSGERKPRKSRIEKLRAEKEKAKRKTEKIDAALRAENAKKARADRAARINTITGWNLPIYEEIRGERPEDGIEDYHIACATHFILCAMRRRSDETPESYTERVKLLNKALELEPYIQMEQKIRTEKGQAPKAGYLPPAQMASVVRRIIMGDRVRGTGQRDLLEAELAAIEPPQKRRKPAIESAPSSVAALSDGNSGKEGTAGGNGTA